MTYPGIHVLKNDLEPVQALADIGRESRGDSNSHREHDDCRKSRQVCGRHLDEKVIEQVGLLA
jgi:hypothetical protein